MTKRFFNKSEELRRLHEGPLGRHIDDYAALLVEGGYLRTPARVQLRLIADFSRWLQLRRLEAKDLNQQKTEQYLKDRKRSVSIKLGDAACLRRLLKLLRDLRIVDHETSTIPAGEHERLADDFKHYLFKERSLAPKTVVDQLLMTRRFLRECFGGGSIRLDQLCATDVTGFIQRHAYALSHARTRAVVTCLRTFLQYLLWRGEIRTNLAACVPSVLNRRFATLPKSLQANQVQLVLNHCDRRVAMGKRDYAILLLLARLGLRAGEVVALRLEDINWEAGEFTICGKGKRMARLPLPQEIGEAIADYLQHGRPCCATRHLFVRLRAPLVGFANSIAISSIVRRALERAGVDSPRKGAHLFRHTLASEMLRRGASMPEIGKLLRHEDPESTEVYAKVDLDSLRMLVLPWPGGGGQ
jgi:site-specific recombinase XerD